MALSRAAQRMPSQILEVLETATSTTYTTSK